jgi:6-phosphofructokinase 1
MTNHTMPLDRDAVRGILARGGTMLGTSRRDPYVHGEGLASILPTLEAHDITTLIVVGGDGTLRTATRLAGEGVDVIGVPKTIDNDIAGTDVTFGFHTAVQIASDAIDRLTTTAESHNRVMVLEVMGRTAGWIAAMSGMAGGADAILVPEVPYELEEVAASLRRRHENGPNYSVVVVAEGVAPPPGADGPTHDEDAFGFARLGGVSYSIAPLLEELTGYETRVTVLGYIQRGGSPTAFDRVLGTRLGLRAAELACEGASGVMVALTGGEIGTVPIDDACREPRLLSRSVYDAAAAFFA